MDTVVATYTAPQPTQSMPEIKNDSAGVPGISTNDEPIEVVEERGGNPVLESLGIEGDTKSMPASDVENLKEVKQYVLDIIKKSGDSPTMGAFNRTLNEIKTEMGLDEFSDPSTILDRIGGVIKAWKSLSFVSDIHQKRSIFMKLSKAQSSSEVNRIVLSEMERAHVWK